MIGVKVKIPTIIKRYKWLKTQTNKALMLVGNDTIGHLQNQWKSGKGGDGKPMPRLSRDYQAYKSDKGRSNIRDFFFKGNMWASMYVRKIDSTSVAVSYRGRAMQDRVEGLIKGSKNMMIISKRHKKRVLRTFLEKMKGVS